MAGVEGLLPRPGPGVAGLDGAGACRGSAGAGVVNEARAGDSWTGYGQGFRGDIKAGVTRLDGAGGCGALLGPGVAG